MLLGTLAGEGIDLPNAERDGEGGLRDDDSDGVDEAEAEEAN